MNTKLIIVDGHSSVGKSSVSKAVFHQVNQARDAYWLHEECEGHPIRSQEFSYGALDTPEGMEQNRVGMLQKWERFRESISASGKVCVTEGCLLHAYDRYFVHSCWDDSAIQTYYNQVLESIRDLEPVVVFLYRPDLKNSLEKAFKARGDWWRNLMLKRDDRHVYFRDHVYVNEDSMYDAISFEQDKMLAIFDKLACAKVKVDTSMEAWDDYTREIVSFIGVEYREMKAHPCDLKHYKGTYQMLDGAPDDVWTIWYDDLNQCLSTALFWPSMPMRCMSRDVFELISFPVELHFEDDVKRFRVTGNYDWEYNGKTFVKLDEV